MNLKEFQNKLDLKKKFPGYFEPWVFRGAFILLAIILILIGLNYGFNTQMSLSCEDNKPCVNLLYTCKEFSFQSSTILNCYDAEQTCKKYPYLCNQEYINPREVIGPKAPFIINNFFIVMFIILFLAFSLNHMLYELKTGGRK